MILYFSPHITENSAQLLEDEFKHCCKVLRHGVGDVITITNGKGIKAEATITNINKNSAELDIMTFAEMPKINHHISVAIAPPKNRSRWEWFLEKSVEIGVDCIIPIKSAHSERSKLNLERSQKIIRSAALQSLRYHHPEISDIQNFNALINNEVYKSHNKFIAHYKEEFDHLTEVKSSFNQSLILIGPEGDFSESELSSCIENGFKPVKISENRLRTETAAIVAVNLLASF